MPKPSSKRPTQTRQRPRGWRKRVGWGVCGLGVALFVLGYIGALTGFTVVPVDRHHVATQVVGLLLGFTGLRWATSR